MLYDSKRISILKMNISSQPDTGFGSRVYMKKEKTDLKRLIGMSIKVCPFIYSRLLYENRQDLLDTLYTWIWSIGRPSRPPGPALRGWSPSAWWTSTKTRCKIYFFFVHKGSRKKKAFCLVARPVFNVCIIDKCR